MQKEVIEATLARDYGLDVAFRETRPICVERPAGVGEAVELLNTPSNPFHAQLGLRVEPAPDGLGRRVRPRRTSTHDRIPLYAYKRRDEFEAAMADYVRDALRRGSARLGGDRLRRHAASTAGTASPTGRRRGAGR